MKPSRQIVGVLVWLCVVGLVIATAQSGMRPEDPAQTNVAFAGPGGVELRGYMARPQTSGQLPAVLMVHEWWGLNHDMALLADALASEGYLVLAVDAFRGSVAQTAAEARAQVQSTPPAQIAADVDAALTYLRNRPDVDATRVVSLGFCFGGTQSMLLGTRAEGLGAVVIFYGGGPITDAARLGSMARNGRVLGIYGANDGGIPVQQVRGFETALSQAQVPATITIYEGVGHAFVKSNTYNQGGPAQQAWQQMVAFLRDTL